MTSTLPDEFTLLCEACGYEVQGLSPRGVCPECGKPISESIPESRSGTRWQRQPLFTRFIGANIATMRHPRRSFDSMAIDRPVSGDLLFWNISFGAAFIAAIPPLKIVLASFLDWPGVWIEAERPQDAVAALPALLTISSMIWVPIAVVLLALTLIERRGIRFFGTRHGWRITPDVAYCVCANASVGWLLAGVLSFAGVLVAEIIAALSFKMDLGILRGPVMLVPFWLPILGFFAGMILFESLVYLGMRRCKFANRPTT